MEYKKIKNANQVSLFCLKAWPGITLPKVNTQVSVPCKQLNSRKNIKYYNRLWNKKKLIKTKISSITLEK